MIFFTGDHHFGHSNIIHYQNRPFTDAKHMNRNMVARWNAIVGHGDTVYHLGDFSLDSDASGYFSGLNGKIYVLANTWHHDKRWIGHYRTNQGVYKSASGHQVLLLDSTVVMVVTTRYGPRSIVLSHYPYAEWDKKHYGAWHLHAHSHCHHQPVIPGGFILDVGVDCHNFRPWSLREIEDHMGS